MAEEIKYPRFDGKVVGGLFPNQPPVYRRGEEAPAKPSESWATLLGGSAKPDVSKPDASQGSQKQELWETAKKVQAPAVATQATSTVSAASSAKSRTDTKTANVQKGKTVKPKKINRRPIGITDTVLRILEREGQQSTGKLLLALGKEFTHRQLCDCLTHARAKGKIRKLHESMPINNNVFVLTDKGRELLQKQQPEDGDTAQKEATPVVQEPESVAVQAGEAQFAGEDADKESRMSLEDAPANPQATQADAPAKPSPEPLDSEHMDTEPLDAAEKRLEAKLDKQLQDTLQHFRQTLDVLQEIHKQQMALEKKVDHLIGLAQKKDHKDSFFQELRKLIDKHPFGEG